MDSFEKLKTIKRLKKILNTPEEICKILKLIKCEDDLEEIVGVLQMKNHDDNKLLYGFESPCFLKYKNDEKLYFNLLECPEVEEGMFNCHKCKSKKIFTMSKQTRSGDESITVFAKCSQCKNQWVINN